MRSPVSDGERLKRVLRVRGAVAVVAAGRVRVGVVLPGRRRVHVAAPVTARKVVRGVVVLLRGGGMGLQSVHRQGRLPRTQGGSEKAGIEGHGEQGSEAASYRRKRRRRRRARRLRRRG